MVERAAGVAGGGEYVFDGDGRVAVLLVDLVPDALLGGVGVDGEVFPPYAGGAVDEFLAVEGYRRDGVCGGAIADVDEAADGEELL